MNKNKEVIKKVFIGLILGSIMLALYFVAYKPIKSYYDTRRIKEAVKEQRKQIEQEKQLEIARIEREKEEAEVEKEYQKCKLSSLYDESMPVIQRQDFNDCIEFWADDNDYIYKDYIRDYVADHEDQFENIFD